MRKLTFIFFFAFTFLLFSSSFAQIPHLINYQGKLTDSSGNPVADGTHSIIFRLYDAENGGNLLWQETQNLLISKGIFSCLLGGVTELNLAFDKPYWLAIKVGSDSEMVPRQQLASVGYAMRAKEADSLPQNVILISKDSCPVGYTRIAELDGKFLVGGINYNSSAGGSNNHTHSGANHRHEVVKGPYSGENVPGYLANSCAGCDGHNANRIADTIYTTYSGEINSADSRPEFATVLFCQKE